jgi:hypothetical protein
MKRFIGGALALLLVSAGCAGAAQPSTSPTPSPTPAPSPSPTPSPAPSTGVYLRLWQTQALPPPSTFMFASLVTVSDGIWIDSNVAIDLIFPGPLLILPNARSITPAGEQAIVEQARELGLLDGETDFTGGGPMPGGVLGHVLLIVDGTRYELSGDPARTKFCENGRLCAVDPGTPEAFAAFYSVMQDSAWLAPHLGPNAQYRPERLALLVVEPASDDSGIAPNKSQWPLSTPFADFGQPYAGGEGLRCAVVTGEDLATLLPALLNGNQLTVFVDSNDVEHSVNVRALVPDEESPCGS